MARVIESGEYRFKKRPKKSTLLALLKDPTFEDGWTFVRIVPDSDASKTVVAKMAITSIANDKQPDGLWIISGHIREDGSRHWKCFTGRLFFRVGSREPGGIIVK